MGERPRFGEVRAYCLHFAACGYRLVRPPLRFALPRRCGPPHADPLPSRIRSGYTETIGVPSGASPIEKSP